MCYVQTEILIVKPNFVEDLISTYKPLAHCPLVTGEVKERPKTTQN